jgi:hypothetical protein
VEDDCLQGCAFTGPEFLPLDRCSGLEKAAAQGCLTLDAEVSISQILQHHALSVEE